MELNLNIFLISLKRDDFLMTTRLEEDIIITTPVGNKLNILKDMVIIDSMYIDHYEPFFEESHLKIICLG